MDCLLETILRLLVSWEASPIDNHFSVLFDFFHFLQHPELSGGISYMLVRRLLTLGTVSRLVSLRCLAIIASRFS